jgi:hypothetical protein
MTHRSMPAAHIPTPLDEGRRATAVTMIGTDITLHGVRTGMSSRVI